MNDLIYRDESYAIMGACIDVYTDKGCGFLEPVYHECLLTELQLRNISVISKPKRTLEYERVLGEFECNGLSSTKFAAVTGVMHQTFAS